MKNLFFKACGLENITKESKVELAKKLDISLSTLNYYDEGNILPFEKHLNAILSILNMDRIEFKIKMGIFDYEVKERLLSGKFDFSSKSDMIISPQIEIKPAFLTEYGVMYQGDCLEVLKSIKSETIDLVFADPPFNLKKFYLSEIDDNLPQNEYINWTEKWLDECIRTLKIGGSLLIWNIPKWNTYFANYLNYRLTFKHWIATDIKFSLPISGKLYPSHYSLLYYTKGEKPNVFKPDRMPMEICPKCYTDLKDYGGYKDKMNPKGVNLTDVWYDIPPVRHKKYKRRGEANELSLKLMDRIIEMTTNENDIVLDPFGGSGTTFVTAELKRRNWIGIELGPLNSIIERFGLISEEAKLLEKYRKGYNSLFPDHIKQIRQQLNLWTDESFVNATHSSQ